VLPYSPPRNSPVPYSPALPNSLPYSPEPELWLPPYESRDGVSRNASDERNGSVDRNESVPAGAES
jgi:hypothetical protein